ncbi:MAG TPA: Re/Si-specific NAD(P)(+) transhydrogenase subunit alpha [Acidobacteriota bacterium]|nr:Re/Si-specific NAD(P)(+) transhydrogenase subunit alpha [Acidobacteriota bacterium]
MIIGIPVENFPNEQRVALVPSALQALTKTGLKILVETGAGSKAGYPDSAYAEHGATIASDQAELFSEADVILQFHGFAPPAKISAYRKNQIVIGLLDPLGNPQPFSQLAENGVITFALELLPRISRAQTMDVLSSMATIAGYKAVLLGADTLKKMFPMLITAAGTITPSRVFIIGAGVAGLQAIATARRLGAVVQAFDVRPAVKEQVESLGAQFVELPLETQQAEGAGGYAKQMDDSFYKKQQELMIKVLAESDVTITTAAVPGKKAPILITKDMVGAMRSGSVIVDVAAETGGNCELTKPGETVHVDGISILGPLNLPSTIPYHASQMFSKNVSTFLQMLFKNGELNLDLEDQIINETLITYDQKIFNPRVRETLTKDQPQKV